MISNITRYKDDLKKLINRGDVLHMAIQYECHKESFIEQLEKAFKGKKGKDKLVSDYLASLPNFDAEYQKWYSESLRLIAQLLPDRVEDFISFYKKPKVKRKDITYENYVIEDALIGLTVSRSDYLEGRKIIADKKAAIPKFEQQLNVLKSIEKRFESSLFDIKQLVQADLYDSELEVAKDLNKKGFVRAAGAVAGVVLEGHLLQVCSNHNIQVKKKSPGINDLAQLLKDGGVVEQSDWRRIQHLADLRNLCDHKKVKDPTAEDIDDLISGVTKIIKNIF